MTGIAIPAHAQTASQITPPTFAPPLPTARAPVSIPGDSETAAPAGVDQLEVTLTGLIVEGADINSAALARWRAQLVGKPIKVADIFAAARAIEAEYARAGHVLTRVVVPAQTLDGAKLRLVVVEGAIERIDDETLPDGVRGRVHAILAPLIGDRSVTAAQIERRVLLAGDTPGIALRWNRRDRCQPCRPLPDHAG